MAGVERFVEIFILVAVVRPLLRLGVEPGFLRNLATLPATSAKLVAVVAADALVIGGGAVYAPWLLRASAPVAAAAIVYFSWRGRPHYGRSRGWPPGSLALAPVGPWRDQLFYEKQAARYGPIFKTSSLTRPTVCVIGFERAVELLQGYEHVLTAPPLPFNRFLPRGFIRYMSPADHSVYRTLFRSAVNRKVIEQTGPFITEVVRRELRRMAEDCRAVPESGIPPQPYLNEIVFITFARLFFGVSPETETFSELRAIYRLIDFRSAWRTSPRKRIGALNRATVLLRQLVRENAQLQRQGGNVPDSFLLEIVRIRHDAVDDPAVTTNLIYIMLTGWGDVSGLMCWILHMLLQHQEWLGRARECPIREGSASTVAEQSDSVTTRIVRETLRLEQSEYVIRRTTGESKLAGFIIPKDWLVRICVRESHRDAAVFKEPHTFNPDRFIHNQPPRAEYSPFGLSPKKGCLGEDVTMLIGRIFVNEVARFDWDLIENGPPEYRGFHWRPSSKLRVHLRIPK
jgi:cytochrome P450